MKSARIVVDGTSILQTERGLNVAVLDGQFNLVSRANFDTFVTDEGVIER